MTDSNDVNNIISEKKNSAEKTANMKFKQYENENFRKKK